VVEFRLEFGRTLHTLLASAYRHECLNILRSESWPGNLGLGIQHWLPTA